LNFASDAPASDGVRWPSLISQAYALLSRRAGLIWYAGALALGVAWCAFTGIDLNYDRLNYHLPSASTLLHGRLFEDVAISSIQTYFNPVINLLSYGLARELGFFWSRYALAAIQALAWAFLAAAVWRVVGLELRPKPAQGLVVGAAMAVLSLLAPLSISIFGTSLADLVMATFISAALLIRLPAGFEAQPWRGVLTGLILGVGVGLKPTILPICVAYGIVFYAMLAMLTRPARAVAEFAAFGIAAALATLLAAGPWALAVLAGAGVRVAAGLRVAAVSDGAAGADGTEWMRKNPAAPRMAGTMSTASSQSSLFMITRSVAPPRLVMRAVHWELYPKQQSPAPEPPDGARGADRGRVDDGWRLGRCGLVSAWPRPGR